MQATHMVVKLNLVSKLHNSGCEQAVATSKTPLKRASRSIRKVTYAWDNRSHSGQILSDQVGLRILCKSVIDTVAF